MENNIDKTTEQNEVFKKFLITQVIAVVQIISFVVGLFSMYQASTGNYYKILGLVSVFGGSIYGFGIFATIAAFIVLSTKKKSTYKKAQVVLIGLFVLNALFMGLFMFAISGFNK